MASVIDSAVASWTIAGLATAGVVARPFRLPEAIWAVAGAVMLVAFGLLPWSEALAGVRNCGIACVRRSSAISAQTSVTVQGKGGQVTEVAAAMKFARVVLFGGVSAVLNV